MDKGKCHVQKARFDYQQKVQETPDVIEKNKKEKPEPAMSIPPSHHLIIQIAIFMNTVAT